MRWKRGIRNMGFRTWLAARLGYWTSEHAFKECPSGERWCPHVHWHPGRKRERKRNE